MGSYMCDRKKKKIKQKRKQTKLTKAVAAKAQTSIAMKCFILTFFLDVLLMNYSKIICNISERIPFIYPRLSISLCEFNVF